MEPRRRTFLKHMAAGGLGAAGVPASASGALPAIRIGDKAVSRLVAGGNPVGGYSYGTRNFTRHMLAWFTAERTAEFILRCEREGIDTWQSHYEPKVRDALRMARERGSKVQWICLTSGRQDAVFRDVMDLKPIAVCHHGGATDDLFREGRHGQIRDFIRKVHDAGALAGVSTHIPDHLARAEDAGWEHDFYMACFYNLKRSPGDIRQSLGEGVLGPVFYESDPPKMAARIRQVKRPCLAYKILAAGRLADSPAALERAFAWAFGNIKPADGVLVGMFPVFADEIGEDAALARKYGNT